MELTISIFSLVISILALALVFSQVRIATKTMKTQIAVSLIDELYSSDMVQETLWLIYLNRLGFSEEKGDIIDNDGSRVLTPKINVFLNKFQIIGHLFDLNVLNRKDLRGIRYEIMMIGRNEAIRQYFYYLNNDSTIQFVAHDHFAFFKDLYLAFEYDPVYIKKFSKCIFKSPISLLSVN